jgi:hypothetical protein
MKNLSALDLSRLDASSNDGSYAPAVRLVAVAALVLALAGCGGDEDVPRQTYEHQLQAVLRPLNLELGSRSVAIQRARSRTAIQRNLTGLETAITGAATALARITPRREARDAHRNLVNALLDYAAALGEGMTVVRDGGPVALREFQGELGKSRAAARLAHAVGAFRDLGYDVGV